MKKGHEMGIYLEIWMGVHSSASQCWLLLLWFALDNDKSLNDGQFLVEESVGSFRVLKLVTREINDKF